MITPPRNRTRSLARAAVSFLALLLIVSGGAWVLTDTGGSAAKPAFDVTGALPSSVMLHVDYDGAAGAANCRQLAIAELWREPQMQAFVAPMMEMMNAMTGQMSEEMAQNIGISLADIETVGSSKLTITLVDFDMNDQGQPDVDLLLTLDLAKDKALIDRIQKAVTGLLENEMGANIVAIDLGGVQGMQTDIEGVNLIWAPMGNHLVLGTQVGTMSSVLARMKAQSTVGGLLENQNFVKARAKSAPTGEPVFTVYGDVSRFLALGQKMAGPDWEEIAPLVSLMGYDSIKDVSYALSFEGRAIVDRMWIGAPKGMGGIYGSFKHSKSALRSLQMAPKDSFVYYAMRMNLSEIVNSGLAMVDQMDPNASEEVDGMIAEMDENLGFSMINDLLPSIGQEMSLWIGKAPFGGMIPEIVFAIEMKDKAKFEDCVQKARTRLDEHAIVKNFKFMGRELNYLDTGAIMSGPNFGPGFKPCWTMEGDFMMMSLAPQTLKNFLAAQQAQRESFKDNADLGDALAHLKRFNPEAGQDSLAYVDIGSLLTMLADTAGPVLQSIHMPAEELGGLEMDMNLYPTGDVFRRHLFGFTAASTIATDGMLTEMYSPMGYGTMIGTLAAGAAVWFTVGADEMMASEEWDDSEWEEIEPVEAEPVKEDHEEHKHEHEDK